MNRLSGSCVTVVVLGALCFAITLCAESGDGKATNGSDANVIAQKTNPVGHRVATEVARDRAKQMYEIYSSTLDVIHRRYFHGDRATVPARAMEDIFSDMKRRSRIEARWISVNTKAMSIDHDPKTAFEKLAAKELGEGKEEIEVFEDGFFRYAGAISLHSGCLRCHEGMFQSPSKKPRYAGLVISVPIGVEAKQTNEKQD